MRVPLLPLLLLLLGAGTSCITATWRRVSRYEPPDESSIDRLRPDEDALDDCLAAFGAPLWVWEWRGDGLAMAYGWLERRDWSVNASLPLTDYASVSFDYAAANEEMLGLVLFFDEQLVLHEVRRGMLRDLAAERPPLRPAAVE